MYPKHNAAVYQLPVHDSNAAATAFAMEGKCSTSFYRGKPCEYVMQY